MLVMLCAIKVAREAEPLITICNKQGAVDDVLPETARNCPSILHGFCESVTGTGATALPVTPLFQDGCKLHHHLRSCQKRLWCTRVLHLLLPPLSVLLVLRFGVSSTRRAVGAPRCSPGSHWLFVKLCKHQVHSAIAGRVRIKSPMSAGSTGANNGGGGTNSRCRGTKRFESHLVQQEIS